MHAFSCNCNIFVPYYNSNMDAPKRSPSCIQLIASDLDLS